MVAAIRGLAVKQVRNGRGIVATVSFRRGAVFCEIKGKLVTGDDVRRYRDVDPRLGENCFRYDADRYIDPNGEIGQYANHSCHPNSGIIKKGRKLLLKTIRAMAAGDKNHARLLTGTTCRSASDLVPWTPCPERASRGNSLCLWPRCTICSGNSSR